MEADCESGSSNEAAFSAEPPAPEVAAAQRRSKMIALILPCYAMVCKTQQELEEDKERKAKFDKLKQKNGVGRQQASESCTGNKASSSQHNQQKTVSNSSSASGASAPASIDQSEARHTYDNYRKWDDFDIDAELEKVALNDNSSTNSTVTERAPQEESKEEKSAHEQDERETERALDAELKEKMSDPKIRRRMLEVFSQTELGQDLVDLDAVRDYHEGDEND